MDLLILILVIAAVIFLWPVIKAFSLIILVVLVILWVINRSRGPRV